MNVTNRPNECSLHFASFRCLSFAYTFNDNNQVILYVHMPAYVHMPSRMYVQYTKVTDAIYVQVEREKEKE
jgi:hypothetical protein